MRVWSMPIPMMKILLLKTIIIRVLQYIQKIIYSEKISLRRYPVVSIHFSSKINIDTFRIALKMELFKNAVYIYI